MLIIVKFGYYKRFVYSNEYALWFPFYGDGEMGSTQGRREGGSWGVKCPPSPPKKIFSPDFFFFFLNFGCPPSKTHHGQVIFQKN